jgi:phage-related protein
MRIVEYDNSIGQFILSLDRDAQADITRTIDMLEKNGHLLRMPHSKKIGKRLYELRTLGANNVRILYTFYNDAAWLLHGFVKKTNKTPLQELDMAKNKLKALD